MNAKDAIEELNRRSVKPKQPCEVCGEAPATYWVKLTDMRGDVLGSEAVCADCLLIVAPALVPAAEWPERFGGNPKP